LRRA
jgi:enoyl-CoA hydratase